jgi:hypothetical protein
VKRLGTGVVIALIATLLPGQPAQAEVRPRATAGNGEQIRVIDNHGVYNMAGGAPIWVSNLNNVPAVSSRRDVTRAQFNALAKVPADGTVLHGYRSGRVYIVAGGAPIYLGSFSRAPEAASVYVQVDDVTITKSGPASGDYSQLRAHPADGTVLYGHNGNVFVVRHGRALPYSNRWVGGPTVPARAVLVDGASVAGCDHLVCSPMGALESIRTSPGAITVSGWAADPNNQAANGSFAPAQVRVHFAGRVQTISANLDRTALASNLGTDAALGFQSTLAAPSGSYDVCVYAVNLHNGAPSSSHPDTQLGQCQRVTVPRVTRVPTMVPKFSVHRVKGKPRQLRFTWSTPRRGKAKLKGYQIQVSAGRQVIPVGMRRTITLKGPAGTPRFRIRAVNKLGDRKSTRLNSSHNPASRMPSSA